MAPEKVLEGDMRINAFMSWKVDDRVKSVVESTCFRWFLHIPNINIRQNWNLITALAKFYNSKLNCFEFESNFCVDFGLEDVINITGLPIDGMQVSGFESDDPVGTITHHLQVSETTARSLVMRNDGRNCFGLDMKKLKSSFEAVPNGVDKIEPYVKAYLLCLLGQVLFPNKSKKISAMFLPLLDLNKVNKYAWGAAVLAYLKCSLARVKKLMDSNKVTSLSGFSYALLVMIKSLYSKYARYAHVLLICFIFSGRYLHWSDFLV